MVVEGITMQEESVIDELLYNSVRLYAKVCVRRGIPIDILPERNALRLHGKNAVHTIEGSLVPMNSFDATVRADNKHETARRLSQAGVRVPKQLPLVEPPNGKKMLQIFQEHEEQIVVKPLSETMAGAGVYICHSYTEFAEAVQALFAAGHAILLEEYIAHQTALRLLMLDGELLAAVRHVPAYVIGDGKKTVQELVEEKNYERLHGQEARYRPIELNERVDQLLQKQSFTRQSIIPASKELQIMDVSNIAKGGESWNVQSHLHPQYKSIGKRVAQAMGLRLCGIDLLVPAEDQWDQSAVVIEVNANPGIIAHHFPHKGQKQEVADKIIDALLDIV